MPKLKKLPPVQPQKVWRIQDFFVAAAVRKGLTDLEEKLAAEDTHREVTQDGHAYRIDWHFGGLPEKKPWGSKKAGPNNSFTIHDDGSWIYAVGRVVKHGKLQPPHAKGWVEKMMTKGTPGEYARKDSEYYHELRNPKGEK
jgi:hypothetical protein